MFTQIDRGECHTVLGLKARGLDFEVICDPQAARRSILRDAGIVVHELPLQHRFDRTAINALRRRLESGAFDIVHVFTKIALSNTLRASKGMPVRIVAYRGIVGNLSFLDPLSWASFLNPRVDRIICVCEAIRRYFLNMRFLWLRVPPEKVVTIYKGHRLEWYQQEAQPDLATIGIPNGAPVIGCVARMRPRKGIDVLVRAFDRLPEQLGAHLVLLGRGQDKTIDRAIAASPRRDRIHVLGFRPEAAALVGGFDVFVLPSLRREGLPRAVIEAMAQGIAPIVTDSGGSPELVQDRVSGRVVPAGDEGALTEALEELLLDRDKRLKYGRAAQRRIRDDFNVERTVHETMRVYQELMAQG
ncbi:glycosyltransferase family 4 protein [Ectothiorhodospiraceae bacterium 2226]|nr:glycosyltransferase family 4 protein [Ectothiorhodospiraceae bacterium 2226]